jgi:ribosomal protein S27AE
MLAMQNTSPLAGSSPVTARPACPNCGRSMYLARTAPRPEGFSHQRIYRCGECGVSQAEEA